jgi:hypothetical protein
MKESTTHKNQFAHHTLRANSTSSASNFSKQFSTIANKHQKHIKHNQKTNLIVLKKETLSFLTPPSIKFTPS